MSVTRKILSSVEWYMSFDVLDGTHSSQESKIWSLLTFLMLQTSNAVDHN